MNTVPNLPAPTITSSVLRYWPAVAAAVLLTALAGVGVSRALPATSSAEAIIVVSDPFRASAADANAASRYAADQATLISSDLVLSPTQAQLASATAPVRLSTDTLRSQLTVGQSSASNTLTISVSDRNGAKAALIANTIVAQYRKVVSDQVATTTTQRLKLIDSQAAALQKTIDKGKPLDAVENARRSQASVMAVRQEVVTAAIGGDGVSVSVPAAAPGPVSRTSADVRAAGLGAIAGFIVAALGALLVASRRRRILSQQEPEILLGVPCLGRVRLPAGLSGQVLRDSAGAAREFGVATAALLAQRQQGTLHIGVVDPGNRDAATAAGWLMATAAVRLGQRVLLVVDARSRALPQAPSSGTPRWTVDLGGGVGFEVARVDPTSIESSLGEDAAAANGAGPYDLVFVTAALSQDGKDALVPMVVDTTVVVAQQGSPASEMAELAERLALQQSSVLAYLYVIPESRGFGGRRRSPRGRTIAPPSAARAAAVRPPSPSRASTDASVDVK